MRPVPGPRLWRPPPPWNPYQQPVRLQTRTAFNSGGTPAAATFTQDPVAGSQLIACMASDTVGHALHAMVATGGEVWTKLVGQDNAGAAPTLAVSIWRAIASGGAGDVTHTATAVGASRTELFVAEYSGLDTAGAADGSGGASSGAANAASIDIGPVAMTNPRNLIQGVGHRSGAGGPSWNFFGFTTEQAVNRMTTGRMFPSWSAADYTARYSIGSPVSRLVAAMVGIPVARKA